MQVLERSIARHQELVENYSTSPSLSPAPPHEPLGSAVEKGEVSVPSWAAVLSSQEHHLGSSAARTASSHSTSSVLGPGQLKCPQVLETSLPLGEWFPWSLSPTQAMGLACRATRLSRLRLLPGALVCSMPSFSSRLTWHLPLQRPWQAQVLGKWVVWQGSVQGRAAPECLAYCLSGWVPSVLLLILETTWLLLFPLL